MADRGRGVWRRLPAGGTLLWLATCPLAASGPAARGAGRDLLAPERTAVLGAGCTPSATNLCLLGSRFGAAMTFGQAAPAGAVTIDPETGFFHFTRPEYAELFIHVIDGCAVFGTYFVFLGSLTQSQFALNVTDTAVGAVKTYLNPSGTRVNIFDTAAFDTCPDTGAAAREPLGSGSQPPSVGTAGPTCTPDATTHCLASGRFEIQVTWDTGDGSGPGLTVPLTSHSGGFHFFSPANLDLVVKVVESCDFFEVHYSGLTNVMYTLTVTDTGTGATHTYVNTAGMVSTVGDLTAFLNPGFSCAIFSDGFETGDLSPWSLVVG